MNKVYPGTECKATSTNLFKPEQKKKNLLVTHKIS